jgi:hypothetical protein
MRSQTLPRTESQRFRLSLRQWDQVSRGFWSRRLGSRKLSVPPTAVWAIATVFSGALVFTHTTSAQAAQTPVAQAQTKQAQVNPANPAPAPAAAPAHKHVHPHKKPIAAVTPAPQPPPPPVPVAPPPPDWPKDHQPSAATVVFDSRGLFIVASNSSLSQILKDVSIDTGAKVEGLDGDQRIFGTYGPGPARDVLSQLLDGSGYNVMLIGDRGQGTPRRILLSPQAGSAAAQNAASKAPASPSSEDTEADQPEPEPQAEQEPPQPGPNGAAPPVPVRTPQQIMQEIEQRRQQAHDGQQNPPNQQNPQN